jgi:putative peptide zinc metalloprotease protein
MNDAFLSSSWHRVAGLKLRPRGHVHVRRHRYRGQLWYVVKDDASGRIHRFAPPVYLFIGLMDGQRTVEELWSVVVTQLEDDAPTQDEIIHLLSQLHAADLLQSNVSPDAQELFERRAGHLRGKVRQNLGSVLSIKIPVLDPDRFLARAQEYVRPLFGAFGAILWLAMVLPALLLASVYWPELTSDPADRLLTGQNVVILALLFPVLKILHELGHGLAAKISGGAVHETGIMLLVFAPVPYVDVSSSAALRSKWRRILIGAAGMLVELFVASFAFYVWLSVEPGLVRAVCYNTMLIAGISTVIFNGNPLLRFDGYYMLCDLIEIPNLGGRSTKYWTWIADRWIFGANVYSQNASFGERIWLTLYAPLAFAYRSFVTIAIALFVANSYFIAGVGLAAWAVASGLLWPIVKGFAHVLTSPQLAQRRLRAVSLTFGTAAVAVTGLFAIPLPPHTSAEGIIWPPEDSIVRSTGDGFVTGLAVPAGTYVAPGTLLVRAEEPDLIAGIQIAASQVDAAKVRLESEEYTDRVQAMVTREELGVLEERLAQSKQKAAELLVRSHAAGLFVVPHAGDLPGRFLRRGEVVGYIAQPESRIVRVVVTQNDIDLVRTHLDKIDVKLPQQPTQSWPAKLLREVPAGSEDLPSKALTSTGGGSLVADPRYPEQARSLERTFQFDLALPPGAAPGYIGSRVYVRFTHDPEPLALQGWRRVRQLFLAKFDA